LTGRGFLQGDSSPTPCFTPFLQTGNEGFDSSPYSSFLQTLFSFLSGGSTGSHPYSPLAQPNFLLNTPPGRSRQLPMAVIDPVTSSQLHSKKFPRSFDGSSRRPQSPLTVSLVLIPPFNEVVPFFLTLTRDRLFYGEFNPYSFSRTSRLCKLFR